MVSAAGVASTSSPPVSVPRSAVAPR